MDKSTRPDWVVETKLIPPGPSKNIIPRNNLVSALHQAAITYPVTLISAPAGYGKTTLASSLCHNGEKLNTAWLSLDPDDNEPVRFLVYLIAALQRGFPSCASTTKHLLGSFFNPGIEIQRLLGVLINDLFRSDLCPLIFVMDDLHVIHETMVMNALSYLIEHLPVNFHLVMTTRYDPELSLPRLRARGHLSEFRAADLRFSKEDVNEFLNQQLGFNFSSKRIAALETRTEGWAAVLRLLATSLSQISTKNEQDTFIDNLVRAEHYIFDFLAEEVLNQQEPNHRKFLLETGILPVLNANICQSVTEQQDTAEILDTLHQRNLIQIAVQDAVEAGSTSYRYHNLFADFLQKRLEREYISEDINQLHNRAAEAQTGTHFAISHYLKAENWQEAAQQIQVIGHQIIFQGLYDWLLIWIQALPKTVIAEYPQLEYFLGVAAFQRGEFNDAQSRITRALEGYEASGDEKKKGEAILILGAIASGFHDVKRGEELLEKALSYPLSPQMKIMAHINRAWVGVYSNNWKLVENDVTTAIQLALNLEEPSAFNILAPHLTAALLFMPNGVIHLKNYCKKVLAWFGDEVGLIQVGSNALMGVIYLLEGNLQAGYQALAKARNDSDLLGGFVWLDIGIDFGLLQHALIKNDYEKFEQYWQSRLSVYERVSGAREYLSSYLFIQGRAFWNQNLLDEAQEIYGRMLAMESPQEIPENQLTRALMAAMLAISAGKYEQAEGILHQVARQQLLAPHSVLFGNAHALLATLYNKWDRPDESLAELDTLLKEYERRNMTGLLLTERAAITPVLQLAVEKGVYLEQTNWLLKILGEVVGFQPISISSTGETLTQREVEVLHFIIEGMTNREIATKLVISEPTVKSHVTSILRKINVKSRTQAIASARKLRLI